MPKRYRIYFNRIEDQPQIWSVDEGSHASEINVRDVLTTGVNLESCANLDAMYPEPKAWLEGEGILEVVNGAAHLHR